MMETRNENIILLSDSYKSSHHQLYPPGLTSIYSYFESRGGKFPYSLFFGLQYIVKKHLIGKVITKEKIAEAKEIFAAHFNSDKIFNEDGWNYILKQHNGFLPVKIKAVREGSCIPTQNVLFTIESTDPNVPWITNFLESLLVQCWYPITVATLSRVQKQIIRFYLKSTHGSLESLSLKLHDFGFRGSTSVESAGIGGAAHLVNFQGTDTVIALHTARKFYGCNMAGYSVPATEHSTITCWKQSGELDAYEAFIEKFPDGILSVVIDSYDAFKTIDSFICGELKEKIKNRKGGIFVIRSDSGDPHVVIPKILSSLEASFGCEKNDLGFKVLPNYLRILQGDGVDYKTVASILEELKNIRWSADNLIFGSGGALLQRIDRDTLKCAFKASHCVVNGESRDVFKDPVTDHGKKSKKGRLQLRFTGGKFVTEREDTQAENNLLELVFENGKLIRDQNFAEIRSFAEIKNDEKLLDIEKFIREVCLKRAPKE